MKKSNPFLLIGFVLLMASCKRAKQYNSCEDMGSSLQHTMYDDLVKDWGEPDNKEEGVKEFYITWKGVGVKGIDKTIVFELDYLSNTTLAEPFRFEGVECDSSPTQNASDTPPDNQPETQTQGNQNSGTDTATENPNIVLEQKNITTELDLPDPVKILEDKKTKVFIVSGLSFSTINLWYTNHYKAQVLNVTDAEGNHYLSMPYRGNNDCISLTIKDSTNNTLKLKFSYQCD